MSISIKSAAILKHYKGHTPGCAITVLPSDLSGYELAYGCSDMEHGVGVASSTNFRLCSVSKQFTAAAVMLLVERGELTLSTTLGELFQDFAEYGKDTTMHHLLAHTSGFFDYEDLVPKGSTKQIHDNEVLVLLAEQKAGYFTSGEKFRYSNGGYCILAEVIALKSKQSFPEFMREQLFIPLGMDGTYINEEGVTDIPYRAYGYSRGHEDWKRTDQNATSATQGDGGVYSSIVDLAKWVQELNEPRVLSKNSMLAMLSPHVPAEIPGEYYGYGFFLKKRGGHYVQYHGGDSIGFRTGIYRVKGVGTVIFLSNRNDGEGSVICESIFDKEFPG
jgi:CubicO group peptidase (beta-lactamase class C family)